ncbi:MAG: hypothetical protein RBS39_01810 [Phycisphaerales bacterium]|nr:hypothetical protein [Phycisphaerales bacterium]
MKDERFQDGPGQDGVIDTRGLPIAALLRLHADGEAMDPEGVSRLEAHLAAHPEDRARIAFDRELRGAVGRLDSGVVASTELRARIERLAASARSSDASPGLRLAGEPVLEQASGHASGRGTPRFMTWGMGLAATLLLGFGLLSVMRSMLQPGAAPGNGPVIAAAGVLAETRFTNNLASFVVHEHERCSHMEDAAVNAKFTAVDLGHADEALRQVFGRTPHVPDLEAAGLEFEGAGRCGVPGGGASMHMRFLIKDPSFAAGGEDDQACCACGGMVSLFVQEDMGQLGPDTGFAPGRTYKLHCEGDHACCGCRTLVWSAEGFVYYLVADAGWLCDRMRSCMGAPELAH